jgi:hypothetical protein
MSGHGRIKAAAAAILFMVSMDACKTEQRPVVTVRGGTVEGDPYSEKGAVLSGGTRVSAANMTAVEDVFSADGARSVMMRAPGGGSVVFDCICKAGGTNLNCEEKCTIGLGAGGVECTCSAIGCSNCAVDLGLSVRGIGFVVAQ